MNAVDFYPKVSSFHFYKQMLFRSNNKHNTTNTVAWTRFTSNVSDVLEVYLTFQEVLFNILLLKNYTYFIVLFLQVY